MIIYFLCAFLVIISYINKFCQGCRIQNNNCLLEHIFQYVDPVDANKLGQCELLVIDEAAAIPLPHVKALLGNYSVFMASTINGYVDPLSL